MDWLKPFTTSRKVRSGDVLFRKGDVARNMMVVASGRFSIVEMGLNLEPGSVVGELGFLAPDQKRPATFRCEEAGQVLEITYDQLKQVNFQNRQFGFYFLQLTTRRLFENIARLEHALEKRLRPSPSWRRDSCVLAVCFQAW